MEEGGSKQGGNYTEVTSVSMKFLSPTHINGKTVDF